MTSTGAVSQPSIAAGEALGNRPRDAGRKAASGEDGGFPGLLSSLAAGRRDRSGGDSSPAGEAGAVDCDRRKMAGWLRGDGEASAGEPAVDALGSLAGELAAAADGQAAADGGGSAVALGDQGGMLAQIVGGDGALAVVNGSAHLAGAVAIAGAVDTEAPLQPGTGGGAATPRLPDGLALADPADATPHATALPDGDAAPDVVAAVAILRRETHLAPVPGAPAFAARMPGGPAPGPGAEHGADGDRATAPSGRGLERAADAQPAAPHLAVTAARGTDTGVALGQDRGAALSGRQAGTDAQLHGSEAAPDSAHDTAQATAGARTDAPAHAGAVSGPVQQLASRITAEASTAANAGRPDPTAFVPQSPFGSPVKVLHIQLQPADLGIVTVRLSLKEQALRLDLEVGRGETAHLIQREREALSALLRSAGYLVDGLEVRVADANGAGASTTGGQPNMQMSGDGQAGSSQADARPQGARPQDQRRGNAFGNERNGEDEQAGHPARRGDLYV